MKTDRVDGLFAALADPTRRRIVDLLRQGSRRAGELAKALDTSAPTMSRHLRVLRAHGVVEDERSVGDARVRVLRLRRQPFVALQAWLDQVEAFWSEQLDSFKAHAQREQQGKRP